ncbi:hypothetical protein SeMB42_g07464 [Synchytrium endobioticum]|uniref:Autophagy protein 5 n=1 Tax=Synchytrium endobioticum TaxID=286115 RepID=A0A507C7R8_9FUNG|nr:hypothetical protein SeMB42_g07464 [Synchytrium endobioticum]TPX40135.1 hypothetical protein SeLEV6574_g06767 [Synchytrium endobioticum]
MDIDKQVTEAIWRGKIALTFVAFADDIKTMLGRQSQSPSSGVIDPLHLLAPRCAYLPLLTAELLKYFSEVADLPLIADDAEVWYEYDGIPLKWHYPIGLLFDLYNQTKQLPWPITTHFSRFPNDKLMRLPSSPTVDTPHDFFMSLIKEADFIRNGSIKKVMSLSKVDQFCLWEGLCFNDYEKFWSVNSRLVTNDGVIPKALPLRVYMPDRPVIQELVVPLDQHQKSRTLEEVLHDILRNELETLDFQRMDVLLHGIKIPPETSISYLSINLSYPDNFLHFVIFLHS